MKSVATASFSCGEMSAEDNTCPPVKWVSNGWSQSQSQSESYILRPTVSRPVHLGVRNPSGIRDQFSFLLEIFFRQLRVCYFVASSLTRGRVCIYCFCWSSLAQSRSGLSPMGLKTIFYCPISWDSPNLEDQVPVFTSISPRNRVAQIYPPAYVRHIYRHTNMRAHTHTYRIVTSITLWTARH
jgi:hypothetical protein